MAGTLYRPDGQKLTDTDKAKVSLDVAAQGSIYHLDLNPELTDWEVQDAARIVRWLKGSGPFFGIAGHMLVVGPPRQGKGTFGNILTWRIARYFGKHVVRDDKPMDIWVDTVGAYTRFNDDTMNEDIARMEVVADRDQVSTEDGKKAKLSKEQKEIRHKQAVERWSTENGEVMLQDAVVLLDEYHRYVDRRRPGSSTLLALGGLIKMWGHLDMLLIGLAQSVHDLDRFRILPYVTHVVKVQMYTGSERPLSTVEIDLHRVRWNSQREQFVDSDKKTKIYLDGAAPLTQLGFKCNRCGTYFRNDPADMVDEALRSNRIHKHSEYVGHTEEGNMVCEIKVRGETGYLEVPTNHGRINYESVASAVHTMPELCRGMLVGQRTFDLFNSKSTPALGMITKSSREQQERFKSGK